MAKPDILDKIETHAKADQPEDGILEAARIFLKQYKIIYCMEQKSFYQYDGKYYKKSHDEEIHGLLIEDSFISMLPLSKREMISKNVRIIARRRLEEFNKEDCLCLENGLLYPSENRLMPHDSNIINTIKLPYYWDDGAICPLWDKTLDEIFEGDKNKIRLLQEFFGYCLTKDTHHEKALMLIGEGRNGKGVCLRMLEHIVGRENCGVLSLKYINDPRMAHLLLNKYVNINTEFGGKSDDFEEDFKKIVSGEPILANPKYINEFKFDPFCKIVFAVNTMPHIDDKSGAFYSRLLIITFNRVFKDEEQNRKLKHELECELSGVLNWAIAGLRRLNERKDFAIDEYMKKTIRELKSYNNPVDGFIEDCIEVVKGKYSVKGEIYKKYSDWCEEYGFRAAGANKFGMEFFRLLHDKTKKDEHESFGDQRRIWPNIVLKGSVGSQIDAGWTE